MDEMISKYGALNAWSELSSEVEKKYRGNVKVYFDKKNRNSFTDNVVNFFGTKKAFIYLGTKNAEEKDFMSKDEFV